MFGITTPDAIALGMMLIAVVAMLKGSNSGAAAKEKAVRDATMVGIAGGIVDANQFSDYVKVGDKLAIALHRHAEALEKQHEVRHTNALEELADKVDALLSSRAEHSPRRK